LRGRPEDVAAQAQHLLDTCVLDDGPPVSTFGPGVLETLQRLPWQGNTLELEAVLRQALADKVSGTRLLLADLPAWVREAPAETPEPVPHPGDWVSAATPEGAHPLDAAAEEYERRLLRRLLGRTPYQ
jgi:DNA-binding NtrC family response regulator